MGGYKPGMIITDLDNKAKYHRGGAKVFSGDPANLFEVLSLKGGFWQYIYVYEGKVTAVIREFPGFETEKVFQSLRDKYGEPDTSGMIPHTKANFHIFGGSVKSENRLLWRNAECEQDVEMVKQTKMTVHPFGGQSKERVAIIITAASQSAGEGDKDLLK